MSDAAAHLSAHAPPGKGGTQILWWTINVLSALILGIGSHWFTHSADHAARIAVLEAEQRHSASELTDIHQELRQLHGEVREALKRPPPKEPGP
jgi:hypothetical protein